MPQSARSRARCMWLIAPCMVLAVGCAAVPQPQARRPVPAPAPAPAPALPAPGPELVPPTPPPAASAAKVPPPRAAFANRAAAALQYALVASRLAADRATAPQVKSHARMMVEQLTPAHRDLAAIMRAKGSAAPPAGVPADKQARLRRLAGLTGAKFDYAYIQSVGIVDHGAAVALLERESLQTGDRQLGAWIAKTLPQMRSQLGAAEGIAGTLAR